MVVYSIASSGENPLTRLIQEYEAGKESLLRRDSLHTTMMEQAASDRQLFANAATNKEPLLRFQEYELQHSRIYTSG